MTSLSLQSMVMLTSSCQAWLPDSSESAFDIVGAVQLNDKQLGHIVRNSDFMAEYNHLLTSTSP